MSQMRKLKLGLEARLKTTISSDHVLVDWIAQHAGFLVTKFLKGSQNGFTALYRMYGKDYRGDLVEFGECVWAKPKRTGRKALRYQEDPMGPRGVQGVWLGIHEETGENLVALLGPKAPVISVRAIAHKPEDERWSKEDALGIEAEPRCPHPRMSENSTVLTHGQSRTMKWTMTQSWRQKQSKSKVNLTKMKKKPKTAQCKTVKTSRSLVHNWTQWKHSQKMTLNAAISE